MHEPHHLLREFASCVTAAERRSALFRIPARALSPAKEIEVANRSDAAGLERLTGSVSCLAAIPPAATQSPPARLESRPAAPDPAIPLTCKERNATCAH